MRTATLRTSVTCCTLIGLVTYAACVKILLVVIDAASPRVVCPAVQTGHLPTLHRLALRGAMHEASVSIFPSITPAATTSIVTGVYPAEHGISGASWFDEQRQEVAYYGDDFWVVAREGFREYLEDFLLRLNGDRMKAATLFEMVERQGRTAGCLNYLAFRGLKAHQVNLPWLMAMLPGVPFVEEVYGPSLLCLGDFVSTRTRRGRHLKGETGLLHRFGMDDASTGALLGDLAEDAAMPDLTVAYFADNDYVSHGVGPHEALSTVRRVDAMLGDFFARAGGMDKALRELCVIVTSDHGHCEILGDRELAVVPLDRVLGDFRQAALGGRWRDGDEIMICPNMRASEIYLREVKPVLFDRVVRCLLRHTGVDQVLWRSELTDPTTAAYVVATDRGWLHFASGAGAYPQAARDAFGAEWSWQGELGAVDARVDHGELVWGAYPNAFERLSGSLDHHQSGTLWATAKPGCEFEVPGGNAHVGGASHGALHALDSLSPLIIAGGDRPISLPRNLRSVDVAPLCMQQLGLPMRYGVGAPRVAKQAGRST